MREFHLVDFAAHYQRGFRNHVVSIAEVPQLVRAFDAYGCYCTYFFYSDDILTYMSSRSIGSAPTVAGYEGKVWATLFPIDLDHPELGVALEAARASLAFFLDRWKIDPAGVHVYFSGSKGFHLMLDARLFGKILPSKSLPLFFAAARRHLALELPERLRETVDTTIRDRLRLLRLPNTVHEKSGLYKVLLSPEEIRTLGPEAIRELAREARPLDLTDETGYLSRVAVARNRAAAGFFGRVRRQVRRITQKPFVYRFRRPDDLTRIAFPCAGIESIWKSHIEPGYRNNCALRLASELRLLGLTEDEAREKLVDWNERNAIDLPPDEIDNVIHSAYRHRFPYRYSCRDDILRRFCPLPDERACHAYVASRAEARARHA